ncbi:MAG: hypothetical protein HQM09_16440 [Candidatus Riflebacteria bacterium]|nr:hypothetical protein [Candidatus Riflebacteria bacterium]
MTGWSESGTGFGAEPGVEAGAVSGGADDAADGAGACGVAGFMDSSFFIASS